MSSHRLQRPASEREPVACLRVQAMLIQEN